MTYGKPKLDGSGKGRRANKGRGGCSKIMLDGKGMRMNKQLLTIMEKLKTELKESADYWVWGKGKTNWDIQPKGKKVILKEIKKLPSGEVSKKLTIKKIKKITC
jgi:hypothetical protein